MDFYVSSLHTLIICRVYLWGLKTRARCVPHNRAFTCVQRTSRKLQERKPREKAKGRRRYVAAGISDRHEQQRTIPDILRWKRNELGGPLIGLNNLEHAARRTCTRQSFAGWKQNRNSDSASARPPAPADGIDPRSRGSVCIKNAQLEHQGDARGRTPPLQRNQSKRGCELTTPSRHSHSHF